MTYRQPITILSLAVLVAALLAACGGAPTAAAPTATPSGEAAAALEKVAPECYRVGGLR